MNVRVKVYRVTHHADCSDVVFHSPQWEAAYRGEDQLVGELELRTSFDTAQQFIPGRDYEIIVMPVRK